MSLSVHDDTPAKPDPMTNTEARRSRNERSLRIALRRWAQPTILGPESDPTGGLQPSATALGQGPKCGPSGGLAAVSGATRRARP